MPKIRLLLADGNADFASACKSVLEDEGISVIVGVSDAGQIPAQIRAEQPDVVLMDSFLKGADALEIMERVMKDAPAHIPKFVVMSAGGDDFFKTEALKCGASYFVEKPFDLALLCDRIKRIAGHHETLIKSGRGNHDGLVSLEMMITDVILQIGVPAHIKGYNYLRDGIRLAIKDKAMINSVTKVLYPEIAKLYETTSTRVERAIRHAIEVAWDRGDVDILNSYFGYTIHNQRGKPTNSEFIAMISDRIRLQIKSGGLQVVD